MMNLKIHFVGLAVIILLLIAIAYKSADEPVAVVSPYTIEIVNASYGLNCLKSKTLNAPDPFMESALKKPQKNNALSPVAQLCNGKTECSFTLDSATLGDDAIPGCKKVLDVDYRCFSFDRPWRVSADESETLRIDCSTRGS